MLGHMVPSPGSPSPTALQQRTEAAIAAEPRVGAFLEHVRALLVPGEQVEAWAIQRRLFALTRRRAVVVATSGRLLLFERHFIAGYDMHDVRWQDLTSIHIRVGLFGADLVIGHGQGGDLAGSTVGGAARTIRGLRPVQAQQVYRIGQAHDQAWREKRRIRDLEEMRARAGGVQIGAGGGAIGALPGSTSADDLANRLQRAKDMVERGLITDAEYEAIKAKIIAGL
jgi:hypothetical protein